MPFTYLSNTLPSPKYSITGILANSLNDETRLILLVGLDLKSSLLSIEFDDRLRIVEHDVV